MRCLLGILSSKRGKVKLEPPLPPVTNTLPLHPGGNVAQTRHSGCLHHALTFSLSFIIYSDHSVLLCSVLVCSVLPWMASPWPSGATILLQTPQNWADYGKLLWPCCASDHASPISYYEPANKMSHFIWTAVCLLCMYVCTPSDRRETPAQPASRMFTVDTGVMWRFSIDQVELVYSSFEVLPIHLSKTPFHNPFLLTICLLSVSSDWSRICNVIWKEQHVYSHATPATLNCGQLNLSRPGQWRNVPQRPRDWLD